MKYRSKPKKIKSSSVVVSSQKEAAKRTPEKTGTNFLLVIPDMVYQQIMWWVRNCKHEVSGFGDLDWDAEHRIFTVRKVYLLDQEVSATSTEINPKALGKLMYETRAETNALKWHWHSHVDMDVFWSTDDREVIRSLAQQGWVVASVFNKKCEFRTAFSEVITVMGNEHELFVDEVDTTIDRTLSTALTAQWDEELKEKVKEEAKTWIYEGQKWLPSVYGGSDAREAGELTLEEDALGYSAYGFKWSHETHTWIYNPMRDTGLVSEQDVIDCLPDMSNYEIEVTKRDDPRFVEIYAAYTTKQEKISNVLAAKQ